MTCCGIPYIMDDENIISYTTLAKDVPSSYLEDLILKRKSVSPGDELCEMLELEHGRRLAKLFYYEWEISNLRLTVSGQEREHGRSLELLFENEFHKMQLQELNRQLSDAAAIHAKDLKMAESVQRSLLCGAVPRTDNFDIAFHYQPYSSVSGDFYDFYTGDENTLTGLSLADISGHGIASSLLTVLTKPIFFRNFRRYHDYPIEKIIEIINTHIIEEIKGSEYYLTSIMLRFNGNRVEYVNAAHPDILMKEHASGRCFPVRPGDRPVQGTVMGVASIIDPYESYTFTMERGDAILVYSDCLIECKGTDGCEFGVDRVINSLSRCPADATAGEMMDALLSDFMLHAGNKNLMDDLSVIILKKK
jgi:phosphoserine phosphatase RsbU/P